MSKFYILSIKNITKETDNSVSITFNIPSGLKDRFSFIPGQYITVQKELNGEKIRRDYSICSSLSSGEVQIGVKAVENGTFSQYATSILKEGDELEVSTPLGRFNLLPVASSKKNHLAFAAGSGITPVLSIVKSSLEDEENSKFVLVYGNKTIDEVMFKADIDALVEKYQDRFFVYYTFSKASYNEHLKGRIDASIVKYVLSDKHKALNFSDYFLCGPEEMIKLVKETLIEEGTDEDQIHFELFTVNSDKDISGKEIESLKGETEITVLLDEEEETFTIDRKNTILESALLKGLDAPYSCQGGICSSCLAKITEGKAVMDQNSILSDEEVNEGFVLTCQAHPTTSKIIIDYDDV